MTMTRRTVLVAAAALATISRAGFAAAAGKGRSIVIFYSRTGTIKGLAQSVAELTGAETLELALEQPYAANYSDMTYIAREERQKGARREIATTIPDLTSYDTIFLGTPYWWGGVSIPMRTFLMDYPLDGMLFVLFLVLCCFLFFGFWRLGRHPYILSESKDSRRLSSYAKRSGRLRRRS